LVGSEFDFDAFSAAPYPHNPSIGSTSSAPLLQKKLSNSTSTTSTSSSSLHQNYHPHSYIHHRTHIHIHTRILGSTLPLPDLLLPLSSPLSHPLRPVQLTRFRAYHSPPQLHHPADRAIFTRTDPTITTVRHHRIPLLHSTPHQQTRRDAIHLSCG
jgi:hypothetical protein